MNVPAVAVPAVSITLTPTSPSPAKPSHLAEIIASSRKRVPTLAEWLTDACELLVVAPAPCELAYRRAYRKLSEPIDRSVKYQDEPLFALQYQPTLYEESSKAVRRIREAGCNKLICRAWDYILAPTVEHKTFGHGAAQCRKRLSDGSWVILVKQGRRKRTLLMDAAFWITPIEKLMGVKVQTVKKFKFDDASPENMDKGYQAFLYSGEPACLSRGVEAPVREMMRPQFVYAHTQERHALTTAWEIAKRKQEEEARKDRVGQNPPTIFKAVRSPKWRTQSAMGKLLSLYAEVTEKMRGDEEADHCANIEELSYRQTLRYLQACKRWLLEKKIAGNQARPLKDILLKSRTFQN
jgi:hypothetical protein